MWNKEKCDNNKIEKVEGKRDGLRIIRLLFEYLCGGGGQAKNVMFMKKAIWISYDLGIGGDYDGLYRWLANHSAVECGDGLAFFNYQAKSSDKILEELKAEIEAGVRINN